jgi:hypothetical protein
MSIHQVHSSNYETQNMYQLAQSKGPKNTDQAERTNTERPQPEGTNITTNGGDRVEISREAQALAQQNNSEQKDQVETQGEPAQAQTEADISKLV